MEYSNYTPSQLRFMIKSIYKNLHRNIKYWLQMDGFSEDEWTDLLFRAVREGKVTDIRKWFNARARKLKEQSLKRRNNYE